MTVVGRDCEAAAAGGAVLLGTRFVTAGPKTVDEGVKVGVGVPGREAVEVTVTIAVSRGRA